MYLPIGLFGVSIATAAVPAVSRHAAAGDRVGIRRTVADALSLMLMLNVPATVGLIALSTPVIRLIFERRAFTSADTAATAAALQFYAIGLVGYSVVRIASPTFYALNESRTPVKVSIASVLVNAALNLALVRVMGYRGLALGTSIAALVNAVTLLVLLRRRLSGLEERRVFVSFAKITIASLVMGAAALAVDSYSTRWLPGDALLPQLARLAAAIGIAVAVLAAAAHLLHIDEFRRGVTLVTSRFRRRRS
jgi:putative peptidoglycan lipid II flippase